LGNRSLLISALFKRAIERLLFLALFAKERMSDSSIFALFKRATKRAITILLFQKERKSKNEQKMSDFPNPSFFAQKKERSLIFKMSECPTLNYCNKKKLFSLLTTSFALPLPSRQY